MDLDMMQDLGGDASADQMDISRDQTDMAPDQVTMVDMPNDDGARFDMMDIPGQEDMVEEDLTPPMDTLDLSAVQWLYHDVSSWSQTAQMPNVTFDTRQRLICLNYDKANDWPIVEIFDAKTKVVGNAWVFINKDGKWYGATWEWLRPGQTCKSMDAVAGDHIKRAPFDAASNWRPKSGEVLYFMVSGLARMPQYRNVNERTAPVKVVWP